MPDHRRCAFRYDDGEQCVWEGSKEMCDAHRVIQSSRNRKVAKRAREKAQVARVGVPAAIRRPKKQGSRVVQPSRVQSARQIIDKLPEVPGPRDPAAPWCTCPDHGQVGKCGDCGKSTYATHMRGRAG